MPDLPPVDTATSKHAQGERGELYRDGELDHETAIHRLNIHILYEKAELNRDNRELRIKLARRVFRVVGLWLFGVFLILLLNGFKAELIFDVKWLKLHPFELDRTVLTALLGAASVIGLLAIVLKGLFVPTEPTKDSKATAHTRARTKTKTGAPPTP